MKITRSQILELKAFMEERGITIENKYKKLGRKPTPITSKFINNYEKYKVREIATKTELAKIMGITRPTLDNLIARYEDTQE